MAALMTGGLSSQNTAIGLPPGLANLPRVSQPQAPPGLVLAANCGVDLTSADDVDCNRDEFMPNNHVTNQTLTAENARLALENELLRRECAQKQLVEAMYGRAAYELNLQAVAAGAFPNPWYQLPMTGANPVVVGNSFQSMTTAKARPQTSSDLSCYQFHTPRCCKWTPSELPKVTEPPAPRVRAETDGHIMIKSQQQVPYLTLMLRNLPNNYSRNMLLSLLESEGFTGQYDFLYLPVDFKSHASLGYAFVNLCNTEAAESCWKVLEGFNKWVVPSPKVCSVNWSTPFQGLDSHVDRYRNSPVRLENVPDKYKPMLFTGTDRVTFPSPTKKIRAPRIRPGRDEPEGADSGSSSEQ